MKYAEGPLGRWIKVIASENDNIHDQKKTANSERRTWFLHIFIYDQEMFVISSCSPSSYSSHFKAFPFLSANELCPRKYTNQLVAELVRCLRRFWRSRDEDFRWNTRVICRSKIRREWVRSNVCRRLVWEVLRRRWACLAGIGGQDRGIKLPHIVESSWYIFRQTFLKNNEPKDRAVLWVQVTFFAAGSLASNLAWASRRCNFS